MRAAARPLHALRAIKDRGLYPVAAVALFAALAGGLFGGLYLSRDRSFPRQPVDFPARPGIDAAISAAEGRLKENPQDLAALVELGLLHFEKGPAGYGEAINELEEAREQGALDSRIFYALGVMYQAEGLYPFALTEYRRYLRNHPNDKEARLLTAKLLFQQGRFAEAAAEYERLKFHFPKDSLIEENLALSLWKDKQVERAVEAFTALKAAGAEESRRAEFYLGQVAFEAGRYDEALAHLKSCSGDGEPRVVGIPPEKVHAAMGLTLQKLSRFDESKVEWEKALALAPQDPAAQTALRELKRRRPAKKK